jgi:hypothetical protein
MDWQRIKQVGWGLIGAAFAATFAVWMFFFPQAIDTAFAWKVEPRFAQVFIGAGYVFRTVFFLAIASQRDWLRIRWIFWGNLVFTGTLLLATYWHIDQFLWHQAPTAHVWLILYIFEPIAMIYLVPRGTFSAAPPTTGGLVHPVFKVILVAITGLLLINGLLLVINPEFAATRWPWELNPLDARIVAAWFLGWCVWCGTMAFATDWDEIRLAAGLFILNGIALVAVGILFQGEFLPDNPRSGAFVVGVGVMTLLMAGFSAYQELRRPARGGGPAVA